MLLQYERYKFCVGGTCKIRGEVECATFIPCDVAQDGSFLWGSLQNVALKFATESLTTAPKQWLKPKPAC
jgi:hypothetical protein